MTMKPDFSTQRVLPMRLVEAERIKKGDMIGPMGEKMSPLHIGEQQ
jgi:hypothetical protein